MDKVLLFDFDGTIADSFENFLEIIEKLSSKYNLPRLSPSEIEELRSEDARTIIKKLKIPIYKIPLIARDTKKMQHENILNISPFNGIPEILKELKDLNYSLGIITSNGFENVKLFLKKNDIDFFDYIHTDSSLFGKDKVIRKFLSRHSINKNNVIFIGDEVRDILACQKVGIEIISVTWGFNSKKGLVKFNPDYLVGSPNDLLKLLKDTKTSP